MLDGYGNLNDENKNVNGRPQIGIGGGDGGQQLEARTCRLYQEGAQKIIGFDFSASLVMDMQVSRPASLSGM